MFGTMRSGLSVTSTHSLPSVEPSGRCHGTHRPCASQTSLGPQFALPAAHSAVHFPSLPQCVPPSQSPSPLHALPHEAGAPSSSQGVLPAPPPPQSQANAPSKRRIEPNHAVPSFVAFMGR